MPLKTYLLILKTGVYLSFVSVLLVFTSLLFPYITSKQIYFNLLIEAMMIFWLGLVVKYPAARPGRSWITAGLIGFFAALLASSIFGVDFNLSFWGDIERMLGWFHIIHFFFLYLIIITVFRTPGDWRNLFIVSLAAAVLVSFSSLFKIAYSTIGNTAYVSGYVIFNVFFALLLLLPALRKDKKTAEDWLRIALGFTVIFILLSVLRVTRTRGAYVGLGAGLFLFFVLQALYSGSKKIKLAIFSALTLGAAGLGLVFAYPHSKIVQNSVILRTVLQISSQHSTFQTRLISWKAAAKDFPSHPILGAGYGNFAISFDKYFDPKFYSYTPTETYFDRAHNNLVDMASTAGGLGLLTYLSIFAAAGYYLTKGKRAGKISNDQFIVLASLFTAYFIQNLAVFDSLVTYISLMITLAYVYWLVNGQAEEVYESAGELTGKELVTLAAAGLVILSLAYQYNVKVIYMLKGTIDGQVAFARGDLIGAEAVYKKALSYSTPLDRDSRGTFINALNSRVGDLTPLDKTRASAMADYAVGMAEANVKLNPLDSMMQLQLAQTLNTASIVNAADVAKFSFYSDRALAAADLAIKASPRRSTVYFSQAQIYITRNDKDKALASLKYAYELNENYAEAACYLAKVRIYYKDPAGYDAMNKCLDLGGSLYLEPVELVKIAINHYGQTNDRARLIPLYERWSALEPNNAQVMVSLSVFYAGAGSFDKAAAAAQKAAEIDPSLKPAAEEFIKKLGGK